MWIITKDNFSDPDEPLGSNANAIGVKSSDYDDSKEAHLESRFRMLDDDGVVVYEGLATSDEDFGPLDDFGMPNFGCVCIEYWDPNTSSWKLL